MEKKPWFIVQWRKLTDDERYAERMGTAVKSSNWGEESTLDLKEAISRADARRAQGLDVRVLALTETVVY